MEVPIEAEENSGFRRIAANCEQQWLYQIGEEGIVYSRKHGRIAALDAAGLLAYRAFDAGAAPDDLAGASTTAVDALRKIYALSRGQFSESPEAGPRHKWPRLALPLKANVETCGIPILMECPDGGPGVLCRDGFLSCPPSVQPARFHLRLHRIWSSWTISVNNQAVFSTLAESQVGLGMLHAVRSILYDEAEYGVAFHAAMVVDGTRGVMLCAPRESGKSVLAAHLAAHGFTLLSDEPALLRLDTASISPVEMPISLKENAWNLLESEWPQLTNAPVHIRSDGVRIKLLHPSHGRAAVTPQRLTHIVISRYVPSAAPRFEGLSPMQTLNLLNEGGMLLGKELSRDNFEQFLRLISSTPAVVIEYSSIGEADQMIEKVLSGKL